MNNKLDTVISKNYGPGMGKTKIVEDLCKKYTKTGKYTIQKILLHPTLDLNSIDTIL